MIPLYVKRSTGRRQRMRLRPGSRQAAAYETHRFAIADRRRRKAVERYLSTLPILGTAKP
jgi:hypothetical protein